MEIILSVAIYLAYLGIGTALVIWMGARHPLAFIFWPLLWPFLILVLLVNWIKRS